MNWKLFALLVILAAPIPLAQSAGIAWLAEKPVDTDACSHMQLNCSPGGVFHLTFGDMSDEMIKDFQRGTTSFGTENIVAVEAPYYAWNTIDYANSMPVCIYYDFYHDDLRFSLYAADEWTTPSAIPGGSSARKVKADMQGPTFQLAFNYDTPGNNHCDLKYISNPSSSWLVETIDRMSNTRMIEQFDIKMGQDGLPHFAWFDETDQCIYYATRTGTNTYQIEEAFEYVSNCTWLELDFLYATPVIGFVDASGPGNQVLRYAYKVIEWYDQEVIDWSSIDAVDMALAEDEYITTYNFYLNFRTQITH